jgi:HEPN domain-containing protein
MLNRKFAQGLLIKAEQDMAVLKKWRSDPDIAVKILGFHAQQAAEKMLKAILVHNNIEYPLTHRLTDLIDLILDSGLDFPKNFEDVRYLTPFAVEFRYDIYEKDEEEIDFNEIYALLLNIRGWIKQNIKI